MIDHDHDPDIIRRAVREQERERELYKATRREMLADAWKREMIVRAELLRESI
jgi:hypothetical protein